MEKSSIYHSPSSVSSDEELRSTRGLLLEDRKCYGCRSRIAIALRALPWLLSLVLSLSLAASIGRNSQKSVRSDYWRDSEFETAKREIPTTLHTHLFEPDLRYNETRQLYRPTTDPPYVGQPSKAIDAAWAELMGPVNVFVAPDELHLVPGGALYLDPATGMYMAQVALMHDLHCLNLIRKSLYREHYPEMEDVTIQPHLEHCVDGLRESIMCSGDMTFIPVRWSKGRNWILPRFKTEHTCRDYNALKEWTRNRDAQDPRRLVLNAERYHMTGSFQKTHT